MPRSSAGAGSKTSLGVSSHGKGGCRDDRSHSMGSYSHRLLDEIAPSDEERKRETKMAKLIYSSITSLDGYIEDENGNFDWGEPDEEVHSFINDLQRPVGIYLYGRRLYEVMVAWETLPLTDQSPYMRDFAEIWRGADKLVYSRTFQTVSSARTRIEREFDPEAVRQMKVEAERDLTIGGPGLAAQAFTAGLVDECHLFIASIVVGGGKRSLPNNISVRLDLVDERRFGSGMVHLRYRIRT